MFYFSPSKVCLHVLYLLNSFVYLSSTVFGRIFEENLLGTAKADDVEIGIHWKAFQEKDESSLSTFDLMSAHRT